MGLRSSSTGSSPTTTVVWIRARRRVNGSDDHRDWSASAPRGASTSPGDAGRVTTLRVPSRARLVTEAPRAGLDLATLLTTWPLLATARRGDGHPVLVLPGLLAGDPATLLLRNTLRVLGHDVSGWSLGTNRGSTVRVVEELRSRVAELHRRSEERRVGKECRSRWSPY